MFALRNVRAAFLGTGFAKKDGRKPTLEDAHFVEGPLYFLCNKSTGKIEKIEKESSGLGRLAQEEIDATGAIVTAAFIDSHTHALFAGSRATEYFMRWQGASYAEIAARGGGIHQTVDATKKTSDETLSDLLIAHLKQMKQSGLAEVEIKTGYSGADPQEELRHLRLLKSVSQKAAAYKLPKMHVTYLALHALPKGVSESAFVDERMALLPTIQKENLASFVDTFPEKGFFSLEESLRLTREALKFGLKAKIHADEITDMGSSAAYIAQGALSIDHLQMISDEAVDLLAKSKTVATLLPATSFFLGIPYAKSRKLIDSGARVALASDYNPGTAPELDFRFTQLLGATQLKMTAAEILCASTYNAAQAVASPAGALMVSSPAQFLFYKDYSSSLSNPEDLLNELILQKVPSSI